jgi:hypothetical protein
VSPVERDVLEKIAAACKLGAGEVDHAIDYVREAVPATR